MKTLYIFGAGVRASILVDLLEWHFPNDMTIGGYYDDNLSQGTMGPGGLLVLGTIEEGVTALTLTRTSVGAFIALGTRASARGCKIFLQMRDLGVEMPTLIAPTANVSPSARIGQNVLILPGAYVGCGASIGHLACMHSGAVVEHHSNVGHNVLLGPNAAIAGRVNIGNHVFIGVGCSIAPLVTVGGGTLLGAGSVVVNDIPAHVVAFGQPATPKREVGPGDEVPLAADIRSLGELL